MSHDTSEWKHFTLRIYINADTADIYRAWVSSGGLKKWFLESASFHLPEGAPKPDDELAQKGDLYEWKWYGFDLISKGRIEEANGKDHLKFTFGKDEEVVTIDIKGNKGRTLLELNQFHRHPDIEDRQRVYLGSLRGWTYHLTNLKSILEGGLDLREKEPDVEDMVNS